MVKLQISKLWLIITLLTLGLVSCEKTPTCPDEPEAKEIVWEKINSPIIMDSCFTVP